MASAYLRFVVLHDPGEYDPPLAIKSIDILPTFSALTAIA